MYIIDSNFFIRLNREIPCDSNDELWGLILGLAKSDYLKVPEKVIEELVRGTDNLANWIRDNKRDLWVRTEGVFDVLPDVLNKYQEGQENFLLDDLDYLEGIADPYVIAHALKIDGVVVSSEQPCRGDYKTQRPKNRQIPDICSACSVGFITGMKFLVQIAKLLNQKE